MDTVLLVGKLALAMGLLAVLCRAVREQMRDLRLTARRRRAF